jgi:putative glycosyltransferase
MKLSIVATLFHSAPYVREFYERIVRVAQPLTDDFEIVFVNDGSPDDAFARVLELQRADPRVVGVDLSRNFGHHKAMMTGLAYARGERVFLIDVDLEEEPELLTQFAAAMEHRACDVVYGVQVARKGRWFERASGELFWWLFNRLSPQPVAPNMLTARLMTRRYVRSLLRFRERELFLPGLWSMAGFEQVPLAVRKGFHGNQSTYTLRRKLTLAVNSITSFSNLPLIAIFYFGAAISALAVGYLVYVFLRWWLVSQPAGWTSVIASVWLLGGLMISFLGVIGIYLSKMFVETKRRPFTIVRKVWRR